jgi:uncharacterized RDD family membrane protein YckC
MFSVLSIGTHLKVHVVNRVIAKLLDFLIVFALAIGFPYPIGPLLGFIYSILADGVNFKTFHGQSVGKKVMKLEVRSKVRGKPANWRDSILRNTPIGVVTFFAIIPVWGWLILVVIGVPVVLMEIYLMLRGEKGNRLGDVMADTEVIEIKEGSDV